MGDIGAQSSSLIFIHRLTIENIISENHDNDGQPQTSINPKC